MGYLNSSYIMKFAEGRKIKSITQNSRGEFQIRFSNGEYLNLYAYPEHGRLNIIATPYNKDGSVKMVDKIIKGKIK